MSDYTGILSGAYYVRHRHTGEVRIVPLGARYNQSMWILMYPVPLPDVSEGQT